MQSEKVGGELGAEPHLEYHADETTCLNAYPSNVLTNHTNDIHEFQHSGGTGMY